MAALLHAQGLDMADANLIPLVVCGATLWFAVGLGFLALPFVVLAGPADVRGPPPTHRRRADFPISALLTLD